MLQSWRGWIRCAVLNVYSQLQPHFFIWCASSIRPYHLIRPFHFAPCLLFVFLIFRAVLILLCVCVLCAFYKLAFLIAFISRGAVEYISPFHSLCLFIRFIFIWFHFFLSLFIYLFITDSNARQREDKTCGDTNGKTKSGRYRNKGSKKGKCTYKSEQRQHNNIHVASNQTNNTIHIWQVFFVVFACTHCRCTKIFSLVHFLFGFFFVLCSKYYTFSLYPTHIQIQAPMHTYF